MDHVQLVVINLVPMLKQNQSIASIVWVVAPVRIRKRAAPYNWIAGEESAMICGKSGSQFHFICSIFQANRDSRDNVAGRK